MDRTGRQGIGSDRNGREGIGAEKDMQTCKHKKTGCFLQRCGDGAWRRMVVRCLKYRTLLCIRCTWYYREGKPILRVE